MRAFAAVLTLPLAAWAPLAVAQTHAGWGGAQALLDRTCIECHGGDATKGGFDLSVDLGNRAVPRLWAIARVRERVRTGEMPPPQADAPSAQERAELTAWCDEQLARELPALGWPAGRVTVRRLSRSHWENSVRDLFSVATPLAAQFPADDLGYGFDNIGDALSFSTLHLEKYLAAAEDVARRVTSDRDPSRPRLRTFEPGEMAAADNAPIDMRGTVANFYANATLRQALVLPRDGTYRIEVTASGDPAGDQPPRLTIGWDRKVLEVIDVPQRRPREFAVTAPLAGGEHTLSLAFLNDFYQPDHPDPKQRDRNLQVHRVAVVGPLDVLPLPNAEWLLAAAADAPIESRVREAARRLAERAYRRAPTEDEIERLAALALDAVRVGEPWPEAMMPAVTAALCSPNFLFRVEATTAAADDATSERPLDGAALAVRLAYFLWSSTPDEVLRDAVAGGALATADGLRAQTERMLDDPRADALVGDFAAQWLELRALADRTPDPSRFPDYDAELRASMRRQTELLFAAVFREGRDVRELLDCDFVHVDARLAALYGLPAPTADGFVRVELDASQRHRGGLLGHAAIHVLTSNPTRTSPVKRGKWILENILGAPPPAPEPGSDSFENEAQIDSASSLRVQLEQHRESSRCAGCHVRMDALGFALERFDPIGRERGSDAGGSIDDRGALPDGREIAGVAGLKQVLRDDPAFVRTALRKLFTYAVGRPPAEVDLLHLDAAADRLREAKTVTIRDLVHVVVQSPPFVRVAAWQ